MIEPRRTAHYLAMLSLILFVTACGSSDESRPIEVLFYVDGLSGTRFMVDGIQAQNADHKLPGRIFEAPYFFILENARQFPPVTPTPAPPGTPTPGLPPLPGIRGCFRTLSTETTPITVYLFYGTVLQERVVLQPGQCYGPGYDPQNPPSCDDFVNPCASDAPVVTGPEVRFELCTSTAAESVPCVDAPASGPTNVAFSASIGDFDATNFTVCSVPEAAISFCTTPAIFYLEDPADSAQGIFAKLGNQNSDVTLHADLYVDGTIQKSRANGGDVIIDEGL